MLGFAIPHANLEVVKTSGDWQGFMEALAFTIALSGLGWTECGNDYTCDCPMNTSKKGIVGWVFLGTAVPEILIMTLGALVGTFVVHIGAHRPTGALEPFLHQSAIPSWFVIVFLLFAAVQLFGINSLDMYSSGVTMQAMGIPVKRYQAVLDRLRHRPGHHHVRRLQLLLHDVSAGLRRHRHCVDRALGGHLPGRTGLSAATAMSRASSKRQAANSLYWRKGGVFWPALVAQVSACTPRSPPCR